MDQAERIKAECLAALRPMIESFQSKVEEAVMMSNVLSQEMASMQEDLSGRFDDKADVAQAEARALVETLNETTRMVATFTGRLEVEIDRFIDTMQSEIDSAELSGNDAPAGPAP